MLFRGILRHEGFPGGGVLAQNAIDQFRELRAQAVEYALEQCRLDILGGLMQQRIGEFQGLGQDGGMHGFGVEWWTMTARPPSPPR